MAFPPMKTLNIPFKVRPQVKLTEVGTETTGIIEIESKLFFTVEEKMYIENAGLLDIQKSVATLAKKLTDEINNSPFKPKGATRVSIVAVNDAIARRINGSTAKEETDNALIGNFLDELMELQEKAVKERDRKIKVYGHMIAKFRLNLDCTIEELESEIGESLLSRLGLFGIYEEMGAVYKEEAEETDEAKVKPESELSEEDVLKS